MNDAAYFEGLSEAMTHLSKRGAFLTTKNNEGTVNTMTISWGYIGFSWEKPFFVAMVRPQRYTHDIIEDADSFTVSIPFGKEWGKALALCGSRSGRDVNKEKLAGIAFQDARRVASPVVAGCDRYYECMISYVDTITVDKLPQEIRKQFYEGDCHDVFYGEIVDTYTGS